MPEQPATAGQIQIAPRGSERLCGAIALLLALSVSVSIGYTLLQYYDRDNIAWNRDSLEYLDAYYGKPVRGIVHYRVLTIRLAQMLPDAPSSMFSPRHTAAEDWQALLKFSFINTLALAFTGFVFYLYQRQFTIQPAFCILGMLLFLTAQPVLQSATIPMVDAIALLTWITALYAIQIDRLWLLFLAVAAGLLNKETILLAAPMVLLTELSWRRKGRQIAIVTGLSIVYFLLRDSLFPGATTSYNLNIDHVSDWKSSLRQVATFGGLFSIYSSFGVVWFLSGWALLRRPMPPLLQRWALLVPGLWVLTIVLSGNAGRHLLMAFPVVIPIAMIGLQREMVSDAV